MSYFVYFVIIVSFLDTFSQLPIMSTYAKELGGSSLIIGIVVGMYSFSNMIGNLFAGHLIDIIGRKKIMLIGMLIAGIGLFTYTWVNTAEQLIMTRFVHGVGGALLVPAAFAYLGDRTSTASRGKTMAISGAAIGLAALLGPAFGGIVKERLGIEYVFYMVSTLLLFTAIMVHFFLPEVFQKDKEYNLDLNKFKELLSNKFLISAYLAAFSLMYAKGILAFMMPLKVQNLGFGAATTGMLFSTFAITAILFFVLPTNSFSDRTGRIKPTLIGLLTISLSLLALSVFSTMGLMIGAMILYGTGFALLFPAITALVVDNSKADDRGRAFGLFYAFFSLGVVIGPLIVGILDVSPNIGFIIGFIGVFLVLLILLYRRSLANRLEYVEQRENS